MRLRKSDFLQSPHGNAAVWRYISIQKFTQLIEGASLFFCNAAKLSDQYEVSIPESTVKLWRKELVLQGYTSEDDINNEISIRLQSWQYGAMKKLTLINCWSTSPHESYALWKIYLGGKPDGVAIRTTVARLKSAINHAKDPYPEDYFIGSVQYRNHLGLDQLSRHEIITTKKLYYKFEEELRLYILNYPLSEGGIVPPYDISVGRNVKVDLEKLLQYVYISPFAEKQLREQVASLLASKSLDINLIRESAIRDM